MAKKRLLAALLAVVLIVSAFPLILNVTASDVTPLSGEKFTGDGTVSLVDNVLGGADSNTYARVYNVENYNATFPQFVNTAATIEAGAYYELHFWARTNSIVNDPGNRNYYLGRVYYGATTTTEFYPASTAIFKGNYRGSYIAVGDEWQEYTIVFQVPASTTYTNPTIIFRGSQVIAGYVPLEFDEMTLIKVDADTLDTANGTYSTTGSYLLDCTSESSEDWIGEWSIAGTAAKAEVAPVIETEFYRASAPASGNTSVAYPDVTLDAGIYELSGDFRLSQIDGSKITVTSNYVTSNTNTAGLTLTVAGVSADSTLTNEWASSTVSFTLTEKTTLSDITLALDSALAFDYKNIVITKTADYEAPTVDVPTTIDGWTGNISVIDDVLDTDTETVGEADTNSYIHVYNETGEAEVYYGESTSATTPAMENGKTYQLSVWMRTSPINCDDSITGDARYKDIVVNLGTLYYSCISQNKNETYTDSNIKYKRAEFRAVDGVIAESGALRLLSEWNKYTMTFEVTDDCTPTQFSETFPIIFANASGKEDQIPFDLDGLALIEVEYDSETGEYAPVTGTNLIDANKGTNSTAYWKTHSGQKIGVGSVVTKLTETEYNRASVTEGETLTAIAYDDAAELPMGVYTVSGKFRVSAIDRADFVADTRVWTTGTLSLDASGAGYVAGNVSATIGVDSWTDASFDFTVTDDGISSLALALDSAADFDYMDLTIEKTGEYVPPVEKVTYDDWSGYIDIIDDVLDTDAETVGVADSNGYVHIYNADGDASMIYRESNATTLTRGNTYQLSVWLRTAPLACDDSVSEDLRYKDIEVRLGTKGNTCISQSMTNPNNSSLIEDTNIRKYVYGEFISLEGPKSTAGALRILPEWNKYTMTFDVTETCNELSLDRTFPIIFISKSGAENKIPFDLDGLSLKAVELNAETGKYDVVGDELIDSKMGTNSATHWYTHSSQNIGVGATATYVTETEYKRASAKNDDTVTALEYVNDDVLGMGVYTVSGKFRLTAIDRADFVADTRVWTTDTLTLSLDSDAIIYEGGVNTATIGVDSWTDVTYTFTLTDDISLEGLKLALSDTAELDYKDLTITKIKDINANWSANGVPATTVNDLLDGAEANEYIHVYDRISELDLVQYSDADVNLTAGTAYTLSVYMREGSIIEDRAAATTPVQVYYSATTTDRLVTSDTVTDALVGDFHADLDAALVGDGWTKYTMTFTPIENQTGLKIIFKILGNADFATTFDIDGLSLVSADGTELITDGEWETVSYAEDTGVKAVTLTESAYNRGVNETEDNTVLTYIDTANEAGTYTVSGKVRLATRSTALVEYTLKQYRPDLWLSVVTNDNNKATLSVYAGDTLGDSAVITDEWSEITLTVSADSAFEALTLALDCAYDLDFDDLTVTKAN